MKIVFVFVLTTCIKVLNTNIKILSQGKARFLEEDFIEKKLFVLENLKFSKAFRWTHDLETVKQSISSN